MWDILFAIVFYTVTGIALVIAVIWYGFSLYNIVSGRGQVVIAAFDVVGEQVDANKDLGNALAHMLQIRLLEIERDLRSASKVLTEVRRNSDASDHSKEGKYGGVVPSFYSDNAIGFEAELLQTANINVSVGGVEVNGIIDWIQRRLVSRRTLKFTLYEKKGMAEVTGSLKPLDIMDDALHVDCNAEVGSEHVDLDKIADRVAYEIVRRRLAQDSSSPIAVLSVDEFQDLVEALNNAAWCKQCYELGHSSPKTFSEILPKIEDIAGKTKDWYQINCLAAFVAENAGSNEKAVGFYQRASLFLADKQQLKPLYNSIEERVKQLTPLVRDNAKRNISRDESFAVRYFNRLLETNLTEPRLELLEQDHGIASFDVNSATYRAPVAIQYVPDITYHEVSVQYLLQIVGDKWSEAFKETGSEVAAILYSYEGVLAVMANQNRFSQTADSADWLFGKGGVAWISGGDPTQDRRPLRSFSSPGQAYEDDVLGRDRQVDHMRDFQRRQDGYYVNSGIFNKAFYEAAKRLGTETAGKIWIAALRRVNDLRQLSVSGFASLLESVSDSDREKVRQALDTVGVSSNKEPHVSVDR